MKISIAVSTLICLLLCELAGADEAKTVQVDMRLGEQRVFKVRRLSKIVGSFGRIVDVKRISKDQFVIYAVGKGQTSIEIFQKGKKHQIWELTIRGNEVEKFRLSCTQLIGKDICGKLLVAEAGGKVAVSGEINDLETYHKIRTLKKAFPDTVFMVQVNPRVLDSLVTVINAELQRAGLEHAKVTRISGRLVLEGTVGDEHERRKAAIIVDALYQAALGED